MTVEEWTRAQEQKPVAVDGHELEVAYYEANEGADGPPVIFLHGIPTWSYLWREIVPRIAADRRVIVPDLLGYGNSSMRDGFDRSIRAQEEMLTELLDRLDVTEVSLVGHDIGGGVSLRYASHNPDAVQQLALSNAVCYESWPVEFISQLGIPQLVEDRTRVEFEEQLDYIFGDGLYSDEPNETFVESMKKPWDVENGQVALARCAVATNTNHTLEIDYEAISADTLLLWGGDDVLQPVTNAERLREDVSGDVDLVTLDRAYHWVTEDRPNTYRKELAEFLLKST